ncbi:MAG TPA: SDR family oxidoreductase [Gaiellaceae bacterium]|nr:SDR family oxidoreductase [Gaiellaceae bacterium]
MSVCIVTGASRGFGRLISERLADRGHRVYATMRDPDSATAEIRDSCRVLQLDVTDQSSIDAAVETVLAAEGRVDVLVNNAGFVLWGPIEEATNDDVLRLFDVNVFGALRTTRAVVPLLRRQGSGVIVQMSSISGLVVAGPFWGHYAASKFALEALSEALAYEVEPFGVRVVLVEPGSYATTIGDSIELTRGLDEGSSPYDAAYRAMREIDEPWPLGDPREVVNAVVNAVEDETTPLRVLLGDDARWYVAARSEGDDEYRRRLWKLWNLPDQAGSA